MTGALPTNLVAFGRVLRGVGLAVIPEQTRLFAAALERLGPADRGIIKAAGRVVYARSRDEGRHFDEAFDRFWTRGIAGEAAEVAVPRMISGKRIGGAAPEADVASLPGADRNLELPGIPRRTASGTEQLRRRDFAELTPDEARDALVMIDHLAPRLPLRPSRRRQPARRGDRLALRAMLRGSLATGGETVAWRWLSTAARPRPMVLICDISGSMETYSRFLLRFAHALRRTGAPVEVFLFGTRLTRVTRELRQRHPDQAIRLAARKVTDWHGGTRIGASLHDLNRHWVRRTIRSSAVVLVASDGWERGDPARLGAELGALRRACHRLIWLNPLAEHPEFEPATAGLQAALPHLDALLPCGSVASLEALATRLIPLLARHGAEPPAFKPRRLAC
ncbi:MAG: VWA domain-containing protein [Gemmatimonadales bacterium]